jgi:hypothetical protein
MKRDPSENKALQRLHAEFSYQTRRLETPEGVGGSR